MGSIEFPLSMVTLHYVVQYAFEKRDFERFGIPSLLAQGFDVRVWDLSPIYDLHHYEAFSQKGGIHKYDGYRAFTNEGEVCRQLAALTDNDFVFMVYGVSYPVRTLYRAISKSKAYIGQFILSPIPAFMNAQAQAKPAYLHKLKNFMLKPSKLFPWAFDKSPLWLWGIRPLDFAMVSGTKALKSFRLLHPKTHLIWAHSIDWEAALVDKDKAPLVTGQYALFIDEYVPFHPDYARLNMLRPCTAEEYYPPLREFFTKFEDELGIPVVIAAHPRSEYDDHPDYYGGRRIIKGSTANLIRHCRIVLAQMSTAVSYTVLYRKPVIFLSGSFYKNRSEHRAIEATAAALGKKVHYLGDGSVLDLAAELAVNEACCQAYEQAYMKTAAASVKPLWETFGDYLRTVSSKHSAR